MKLCALIAAAGTSSRMGFHKAMYNVGGRPAAVALSRQMKNNLVDQIFLTLPPALLLNSSLTFFLHELGVATRANRFPALEYSGSIKSIVEEAGNNYDGIIITPIDAFHLATPIFLAIKYTAQIIFPAPSIIVPHHLLTPGHPVFFSSHFFQQLIEARYACGMRGIIKAHKKFVKKILWPDESITMNMNYPQKLKSQRLFLSTSAG